MREARERGIYTSLVVEPTGTGKSLIVDSRNELIVQTLQKYFYPRDGFFKQGIVFCVNIGHAKKLEKMMTAAGFAARAVYGGNKHNEEIFEQYADFVA